MDKKYEIRKIDMKKPETWIAITDDMSPELRDVDKREITAFSESVWDGLYESIAWSDECWQALDEKENPLAIWGIREMKGRRGRLIWCLCTKDIKGYWRPFARESKKILDRWADEYGLLYNAVSEENEEAIRWLKWCGAVMSKPFTACGMKFLHFWIQRTILGQNKRKDDHNVQHNSRIDGTRRTDVISAATAAGGSAGGSVQGTGSGLQGAGGSTGAKCESGTQETGVDS